MYYPLEDSQGSGSTITDHSGTNLVRESFNAFGLPRDGSDWDGAVSATDQATIRGISRRGYTGHSMLGAMGLIHMNGRVQDAVTGRFLSADPNIPDPGFTQSFNRYAYVYNNPLSYIDPSGFCPTIRPAGCEDDELDEVGVTAAGVCNARLANRRFCGAPRPITGCRVTDFCDYYTPPNPYAPRVDCLILLIECGRGAGDDDETVRRKTTEQRQAYRREPRQAPQGQATQSQSHDVVAENHCGGGSGMRAPNQIGDVSYDAACDTHDRCYDNSGWPKLRCDWRLGRDIYETFADRDKPLLGAYVGTMYFEAVTIFGWPYYERLHSDVGFLEGLSNYMKPRNYPSLSVGGR